ncbi:27594_t:CDS:2 [Dentiscutata erythropus]|uniref:27594_t:CDS:1 n=1 Tax=Dentiscutata erythropus TaxID=1348616 RepID=A0A9N9N4Z5_9GLOM|nr:27594_t:CDS:2 [Dentiscutata erythropus]
MDTNDSEIHIIHKYFERNPTDWSIREFLDKCEEKKFDLKIQTYCLSLENIIKQGELNHRHGKAQLLLDWYKKSMRRATKPVWGTEKTTSFLFLCSNLRGKQTLIDDRPSIHFHQLTFLPNTINGINNTGAFDIHLLKKSRKRKKDQEDEDVEDEGIDNSAILYDRLIMGINTARENQTATACLMTPLYWGVVDLRAENVSPYPKHSRVKEFLSDMEVQNLQQTAIKIITEESHLSVSVKTLLEMIQCSTFSLRKLSKEKRARGIAGICSLLKIDAKIYDKDTQYIGECMDAFDLYSIWEWSSQDLPRKDDDIITAMTLCKRFLIYRNLLNRISNLSQIAIRLSQIFREDVENMQVVHINKSVKLSPIVALKEKRVSSKKNEKNT